MEHDINYREELEKVRAAAKDLERDGTPTTLNIYWELCCGDVLVAEENLRNQGREWENATLAEEFLDAATYLENYDDMLDNLYSAVSRMVDTIYDHPRLKLKLLEFELLVIHRIESLNDRELDVEEDIQEEISLYRYNIQCADKGDFDSIKQTGHLKNDPIEWSETYERVIDDVNKKVYLHLKDHPRGMGFCFAYWHVKEQILREDYGILWKSPAVMNPHVMFD